MAITALHTAATGMQALSTKIDVIANNIANADTVAFKAARANAEDLAYQIYQQPGVQTSAESSSPLGTQIGLGTAISNTQILFQQGGALATENPLDVMIQGDGFFQVELPGGATGYTRAGNFIRNADGELVLGNSFGYRLKDTPTIDDAVPTDAVSISSDGTVSITNPDGTSQAIGQLELARFVNPDGLLEDGGNIFLQSAASGEPIEDTPGNQGLGLLHSGHLEQSNTEAVTELVNLIKTQRVFQMNSQSIRSADEMLQVVAQLKR